MPRGYEYRGFMSYSHHDSKACARLHKALETYAVPRSLKRTLGRDGPVPANLMRIYRDRVENEAAPLLGEVIENALQRSTYLVVLCSPHAASSPWVEKEILYYKRLGREDRILPIILSGEPNANPERGARKEDECFPQALKFRIGADGKLTTTEAEPIAADARPHGDGRRNATLKLVAGLLGVKYDAIKRREDGRRLRRFLIATALLAGAVGGATYYAWDTYDRGHLTVTSMQEQSLSGPGDADSTSITVDGIELGANIRNLELRSGPHRLVARANGRFEHEATVIVPRQGKVGLRFWLEDAFTWVTSQATGDFQTSHLAAASSDRPLIVASHGSEVIVSAAVDGATPLWRAPVPDGEHRTFRLIDAGALAGEIIVSGREAQNGGPEAIAFRAAATQELLWDWRGANTGYAKTSGLAIEGVATPQGPAVGLAGRDGRVVLLDAETGAERATLAVSPRPYADVPDMRAWNHSGVAAITLIGRIEATGRTEAVTIRVADGVSLWRREFDAKEHVMIGASVANSAPQVLSWSDVRWSSFDAATGRAGPAGTLPEPLIAAPAFAEIDGGAAIVMLHRNHGVVALRASDGRELWRSAGQLSEDQPRTSASIVQTASGDFLVARSDGLSALSAVDGVEVWSIPGQLRGVHVGDWDGDGVAETFASMAYSADPSGPPRYSLFAIDARGRVLWKLALEQDLEPWGLVNVRYVGGKRGILLRRHAGITAMIHGPRGLWEAQPSRTKPIQATPAVGFDAGGDPIVALVSPFGSEDGLVAFDGRDGGVLWNARESFSPNRGAVVARWPGSGVDEVFALGRVKGEANVMLLGYRLTDGALMRSLKTPFTLWLSCTPVLANFRKRDQLDVALSSSSYEERAIALIDGRTGLAVWQVPTSERSLGGVAAADITDDGLADVIAVAQDGSVYAIRGSDGHVLWTKTIEHDGWSVPLVVPLPGAAGPQVIIISRSGRLYVFDGRTGADVWASPEAPESEVYGHAAVSTEGGRTLLLAPGGAAGLVAFDWTDRREVWRTPPGWDVRVTPVVTRAANGERAVLIALETGQAALLRVSDGQIIWVRGSRGYRIESDPVLADLNRDGVPDILITDTGGLRVVNGRDILARG